MKPDSMDEIEKRLRDMCSYFRDLFLLKTVSFLKCSKCGNLMKRGEVIPFVVGAYVQDYFPIPRGYLGCTKCGAELPLADLAGYIPLEIELIREDSSLETNLLTVSKRMPPPLIDEQFEHEKKCLLLNQFEWSKEWLRNREKTER